MATKHARRIACCHTFAGDVFGDDAACSSYGAAADANAGKDDHFCADPDMVLYDNRP